MQRVQKGQIMGIRDLTDYTLINILYLLFENEETNAEFCTAININKSSVTDWRNGKTASYKKHLVDIAKHFEISVSDLVSDQFIVSRLMDNASPVTDEDSMDIIARTNELHSFPLDVQDIGFGVMRGISKKSANDK